MHTQMDINCKMRAILIDWIVEVHLKFKLADPTLYLTCHIIDRFCMQENVHRSKLQLVGVTALLIACKYEEIFPTEVHTKTTFTLTLLLYVGRCTTVYSSSYGC